MPYSWTLGSYWYRFLRNNDIDRYQIPLDPFKIVWVDPNNIKRNSNRKSPWSRRWPLFGTVMDGDWDHYKGGSNHGLGEYFSNRRDYLSLKEHFVNNVPWEETELIVNRIEQVERGEEAAKGSQTKEDVLFYCEHLDNIYDDIQEEGFKTQKELIQEGKITKGFRSAMLDEICIDIGRDGELLFVDGRHRLSIAKFLDLNQIPVVVLVRHEEWMEYLEENYIKGKLINHPDMSEFGTI